MQPKKGSEMKNFGILESTHPKRKQYHEAHIELHKIYDHKGIIGSLNRITKQMEDLEKQRLELEKGWMVNANVRWKKEVYMELETSQVNGKREKMYVGNKKEKQEEAQSAIERYAQWEKICEKLYKYQNHIKRLKNQLEAVQENLAVLKEMRTMYGF